MSDQTHSSTSRKFEAFIIGIFVTGVMGFAVAKELGSIDGYLAKRSIGIILGLLLIMMGNFLPKIVRPLAEQAGNPARAMAAERFAGRMFMLGGLAYISVWIYGSQESAPLISSLIGIGAFVLAAANWMRLMGAEMFGRRDRSPSDAISHARLQILFALFWVFAIFLGDAIWGDYVSQPMAIGYVIVIGIWAALRANKARLSR